MSNKSTAYTAPGRRARVAGVLLAVWLAALLAAAGCGSAAPTSHHPSAGPAPAASTAPASPPAPLACSTVLSNGQTASQEIGTVVQDQVSQDQSLEQNWVDLISGSLTSQGNDLNQAASLLAQYPVGSSPLASAGQSFYTDGQTFITDQGNGLMPGWVPEYRNIQHDIAAMGSLCGIPYALPSGE